MPESTPPPDTFTPPQAPPALPHHPPLYPERYSPLPIYLHDQEKSLLALVHAFQWNLHQLYDVWCMTPRTEIKSICLLAMTTAKLISDRYEIMFPHYADKHSNSSIPIIQPLD